jgi:hypothetical protein
MTSRALMALALVMLATVCAGCAVDSTAEELPEPGLTTTEEGKAQAVGTFSYVDLEGGFWRIAESASANEAQDAPTVVVIANAESLPEEPDSYEGEYVRATGELFEGATIRMAGQEMIVEDIEVFIEAE